MSNLFERRRSSGIFRFVSLAIFAAIAAFSFGSHDVSATDLTVNKNGWEAAPATEVSVPDLSKISLNTAFSNGDYYIKNSDSSNQITIIKINNVWAHGDILKENNRAIIVKPVSGTWDPNTEYIISGKIIVVFRNVARYKQKNTNTRKNAHIVMTISGISVKTKKGSSNSAVAIFSDYGKKEWGPNFMSLSKNNDLTSNNDYNINANYDIKFEVYDTSGFSFDSTSGTYSGTKLSNYVMLFGLVDLDHYDTQKMQDDHVSASDFPTDSDGYYLVNNSAVKPYSQSLYSETATYIGTFKETTMYLEPDTYITPVDTSYGKKTRAVPKKISTDDTNLKEQRRSGALVVMDAGNIRLNWGSSEAATGIGFLNSNSIYTETATSNISISSSKTASDGTEVFWKESTYVDIYVDTNYKLSKIAVGAATQMHQKQSAISTTNQNISTLLANGTLEEISYNHYRYHFNSVTNDHRIIVSAEPVVFEVCKNGNRLTSPSRLSGASMKLTATSSGASFSGVTVSSSDATFSTHSNTVQAWTTGTSGCISLSGAKNGTYTLSEISAPQYFNVASDITFDIKDGAIINTSCTSDTCALTTTSIAMKDTRKYGTWTIKKELVGDGVDPTMSFNISLVFPKPADSGQLTSVDYYVGSDPTRYTLSLTNGTGSLSIVAGTDIMLRVPYGYSFYVRESDYSSSGYSTYYSAGTQLMNSANKETKIVNTKGSIEICKKGEHRSGGLAGATMHLNQPSIIGPAIDGVTITKNDSTLAQHDEDDIIWTTGNVGCIGLKDMPDGQYVVAEDSAPAGFIAFTSQITITVSNGQITNVVIPSDMTDLIEWSGANLTITDERQYFDLTVGKEVRGNGGDTLRRFMHYLTITPAAGTSDEDIDTITYTDSTGTTTESVVGGVIKSYLSHGETVVYRIPYGFSYTIDEYDYSPDGYTTTYTGSQTGTMTQNKNVTIINTREETVVTGIDMESSPIPFIILGSSVAGISLWAVRRIRC